MVKRRTDRRRLARKLKELRTKAKRRMHTPVGVQRDWLASVLRGHYAYHGLPSNRLDTFYDEVRRFWYRVLNRRAWRDAHRSTGRAPLKIRVNTVNPAPIETRMMHSIEEQVMPGHPGQAKEQFQSSLPVGRYRFDQIDCLCSRPYGPQARMIPHPTRVRFSASHVENFGDWGHPGQVQIWTPAPYSILPDCGHLMSCPTVAYSHRTNRLTVSNRAIRAAAAATERCRYLSSVLAV